jgi:steroid delta-isomerase-like uncharacterized protein
MSSKQETMARRLIEDVWNNGKYDTLGQLVTPDFANHDPMSPTKGIAAFSDAVKKYRTAFPDLRQEIQDLFSSGDKVVVRLTCTGTHRGPLEGIQPTGRHATVTAMLICRFAGDLVAESYVNWDALGLMQQLGVVTLPGKSAAAGA